MCLRRRDDARNVDSVRIPPDLYSFDQLKDVIDEDGPSTTIAVSKVNGLITLAVSDGWEVLLTDGLLSLLGLDDGLGGA